MILGPLLVASLLPIWAVWSIGQWEAVGETGTLWGAFGMLPMNVRTAGVLYVVGLWESNLVKGGFLLLLGFGVERWFVIHGQKAAA